MVGWRTNDVLQTSECKHRALGMQTRVEITLVVARGQFHLYLWEGCCAQGEAFFEQRGTAKNCSLREYINCDHEWGRCFSRVIPSRFVPSHGYYSGCRVVSMMMLSK